MTEHLKEDHWLHSVHMHGQKVFPQKGIKEYPLAIDTSQVYLVGVGVEYFLMKQYPFSVLDELNTVD